MHHVQWCNTTRAGETIPVDHIKTTFHQIVIRDGLQLFEMLPMHGEPSVFQQPGLGEKHAATGNAAKRHAVLRGVSQNGQIGRIIDGKRIPSGNNKKRVQRADVIRDGLGFKTATC